MNVTHNQLVDPDVYMKNNFIIVVDWESPLLRLRNNLKEFNKLYMCDFNKREVNDN